MLNRRDALKIESLLQEAVADWLQMRESAVRNEDDDEYNRLANAISDARDILGVLRSQ